MRDSSNAPTSRAVVLTAHGTASPRGQAVVHDLVAQVSRLSPDLVVRDAYVDVQEPKVADVVAELAPHFAEVIVVPLLFCGGYHVRVDVEKAVKPWSNARSTGALGPSERLAQLMVERLKAAGATPADPVVMAAAGSSRPDANADARVQARLVGQLWGAPVAVGFGSAGTPRIADAIAALQERPGARVAVASLLLGEGHFYELLLRSGADIVAAPLGAESQVVAQIMDRIEAPVR